MEDYEKLEKIGSGSYGIVNKCRHKGTGEVVAIKKFLETEADPQIRKIAVREVKMLKALKHGNLVCLKDVFRRKKKLHMVFEFIDHTVLNELDKYPKGLPTEMVQKITWQVLSAIEFCHQNDVVHRDVKPENILVSEKLLVKLCDFGFARRLDAPPAMYTDYVATRWYRAPELLVGDVRYDSKVDVWAIGCLFGEMLTGRPVWPGKSDVDQLWRVICTLGAPTKRLEHIFHSNSFFEGRKIPTCDPATIITLQARYGKFGPQIVEFMEIMLKHCSSDRGSCTDVKAHGYFDGFRDWFMPELEKLFAEPPMTINPPAQESHTIATVDRERQIGVKQQRASEGSIKQTSQMIDSMTLGVPGQQRRSHRTHAKHASQFISLKDPKKRKQKLSGLSNGTQKRKPATSLKIFKDEEKSRGFHLPSIGK